MTEEQQIRMGERVEQFMADEAWALAVQQVRAGLVEDWIKAKTKDTREEIHARMSNLDGVVARFRAIADNAVKLKHDIAFRERQAIAEKRRGQ